jgi:hypothetical protein
VGAVGFFDQGTHAQAGGRDGGDDLPQGPAAPGDGADLCGQVWRQVLAKGAGSVDTESRPARRLAYSRDPLGTVRLILLHHSQGFSLRIPVAIPQRGRMASGPQRLHFLTGYSPSWRFRPSYPIPMGMFMIGHRRIRRPRVRKAIRSPGIFRKLTGRLLGGGG